MRKNLLLFVVIITTIVLLIGAVLFAVNGRFARFWADDYCYSLVAKNDGILQGTETWYNDNGSRVASFWFVAIMDVFGQNALKYLPAIIMALWILASVLFFNSLAALFSRKIKLSWVLLASLLVLFFTLFLMPTRLQTLYWRMATLHYTLPIPLTFLNLAWILRLTGKKVTWLGSILSCLAVLLIAFVSGANSESSGALLVGIYLVVLFAIWVHNRVWKENFSPRFLLFGLAGSIAAVIIMASSPSTDWRMAAMPPPTSLYEFLYYTVRYSLDFVVDSFKTQPLPNLVFMLGSLATLLALIKEEGIRVSTKWSLLGLMSGLAVTIALIIFSVSPSVYAGVNYPSPRALMPSRFALLAGMFGSLYFLALMMNNLFKRVPSQLWTLAEIVVLLGVAAYTIRSFQVPVEEGIYLAGKADLWDKQDQEILDARAAGEKDIVIREYDVVDTLDSLKTDSTHWLNGCASGMYSVNSITALP